ncbi:MAG: LamG domain-containing protein, partial [Bacteroidota bacterium]
METFRRYLLLIYFLFFILNNAFAQVSSALKFDGSNDYVQFSQHLLPVAGDFTIETWLYLNNSGTKQTIISQGVPGDAFYISISNSGALSVGDDWLVTGVNIPFQQWLHLAIVRSGTQGKIYVNGILANSTSAFSPSAGGAFTKFGVQTDSTSEFANVYLDELRIWSIERLADQIQSANQCQFNSSLTSLTANYHFDNGVPDGNNNTPLVNTITSQIGGPSINGILNGFDLTGTNSNFVSFTSGASGNPCSLFYMDNDGDLYGNTANSVW